MGGSGVDVALGSGVNVSVGVIVGFSVGGASVDIADGSTVAVGGSSVGGNASAVVSLPGMLQAARIIHPMSNKQKSFKRFVLIASPELSILNATILQKLFFRKGDYRSMLEFGSSPYRFGGRIRSQNPSLADD